MPKKPKRGAFYGFWEKIECMKEGGTCGERGKVISMQEANEKGKRGEY